MGTDENWQPFWNYAQAFQPLSALWSDWKTQTRSGHITPTSYGKYVPSARPSQSAEVCICHFIA